MQELENDLSRVPLEKLGIEEYAKQGQTIVEGGYLQTILINADRIDTGTLNAGNVTISSDDGTTFNLQGNDLTIDTNQFSLDSAGNAEFGGNLNAAGGTFAGGLEAASGTFAGSLEAAGGTFSGNLDAVSGSFSDGNVNIDSSGITISSGGLTVTNPDGDVIIDGESDMFKIHQTGTVSVSAGGSISVHHGLGYAPAFLFFIDFEGSRNFPIYNYLGVDIGYYGVRAETNSTSVVFSAEYINTNIKYFILKEEAF